MFPQVLYDIPQKIILMKWYPKGFWNIFKLLEWKYNFTTSKYHCHVSTWTHFTDSPRGLRVEPGILVSIHGSSPVSYTNFQKPENILDS